MAIPFSPISSLRQPTLPLGWLSKSGPQGELCFLGLNGPLAHQGASGIELFWANSAEAPFDLMVGPNPGSTPAPLSVQFLLLQDDAVNIAVYDLQGRQVTELAHNLENKMGRNSFEIEAGKLTPGIYFVQLNSEQNGSLSKKVVIIDELASWGRIRNFLIPSFYPQDHKHSNTIHCFASAWLATTAGSLSSWLLNNLHRITLPFICRLFSPSFSHTFAIH